jgi:hypothetical protein
LKKEQDSKNNKLTLLTRTSPARLKVIFGEASQRKKINSTKEYKNN